MNDLKWSVACALCQHQVLCVCMSYCGELNVNLVLFYHLYILYLCHLSLNKVLFVAIKLSSCVFNLILQIRFIFSYT